MNDAADDMAWFLAAVIASARGSAFRPGVDAGEVVARVLNQQNWPRPDAALVAAATKAVNRLDFIKGERRLPTGVVERPPTPPTDACPTCGTKFSVMFERIDGPNRKGCPWCEDKRTIALRKIAAGALVDVEEHMHATTSARLAFAERVVEALGMDTPWPVLDCMDQLSEWARHLLHDHNCDHVGYERLDQAVRAATAHGGRLRAALDSATTTAPPVREVAASAHPWSAFLHARSICLRWLRDEMGDTLESTCAKMRMDPVQVRQILMYVDATYSADRRGRTASDASDARPHTMTKDEADAMAMYHACRRELQAVNADVDRLTADVARLTAEAREASAAFAESIADASIQRDRLTLERDVALADLKVIAAATAEATAAAMRAVAEGNEVGKQHDALRAALAAERADALREAVAAVADEWASHERDPRFDGSTVDRALRSARDRIKALRGGS